MPYLGNPAQQRFSSPRAASVYSGDGSTVAFTLEEVVSTDEDILVSVDGVIQEPSVAYAVSSGTTLTFTAAPSTNSGNNIFVYYIARTFGSVSMPDGQNVNAANGTFSGTLGVTGETTLATHLNLGDSDRIKLGAGSDLQLYHDGTDSYITNATNSLKVDSNAGLSLKIDGFGHVTKPLQPAFSAYLSGTQTNIAVGSDVTVSFAAERFDQNADFNTSNYTFTAPVTGKYLLSVSVQLSNSLDSAASYYQAKIVTSNKTYNNVLDPDFGQDNLYFPLEFSVLADMDADDTAIVKIAQTAGSQQTNVDSQSHFTGFLAC